MGSAPPASSTRESSSLTALSTLTTSQRMRTFCISEVWEHGTDAGSAPVGIQAIGRAALVGVVHELELDRQREAPREEIVGCEDPRKDGRENGARLLRRDHLVHGPGGVP